MFDGQRTAVVFSVIAVAAVTVAGAPVLGVGPFADPAETDVAHTGEVNTGTQYVGDVEITLERDTDNDGTYETIMQEESSNLVLNQGLDFFAGAGGPDALLPSGASETDDAIHISLSSDGTSPSASDTKCQSEITSGGLSRSTGTTITLGTGNYSAWNTFTATSSHNSVQKTCLNWDSTNDASTAVAMNTFQSVDLLADDKLTVNWTEVSLANN